MQKDVPTKNYIILGIIYLSVILIALYISNWYKQSDFNDHNSITEVVFAINPEEWEIYIQENPDIIVYFSNSKNNDENLQQKIGNYIVKKNLTDNVIYMDTYDISPDWINVIKDKYISDTLNQDFKLNTNIDTIVAIKDGIIVDYTQILKYDDAKEFLNRYGVLNND